MSDGNEYFPGVDYNPINSYKTTTELNNSINELCKYHKTIITFATEIIELLKNIKQEGVSNIEKFNFSAEFLY